MSIAVSAIVQPSRLLSLLTLCMSFAAAAIAAALGIGLVGSELAWLARFVLAIPCGFAALFGFYHGIAPRKNIHIDISGAGQIRIRSADDKWACTNTEWPHVGKKDEVVGLLPTSTLWPQLLLLRLQAESGKITVLPVLPDCLSREAFRALSVACRWIATQSEPAASDIF